VLIRNAAPVFGANATPYEAPGQWTFSVSSRNLVSNDHYSGTVEQVQRQTLANYVTNRQNLLDLSATLQASERFSISVGVPFINSSWASRDPRSPLPGPRVEIKQNGRGVGDITLTGRYWVLDTLTHPDWNVMAVAGVKTPAGNSRTQDMYPDRTGENNQLRYVDQSVQTGDGGWGLMLESHGFWKVRRVFVFGSGSYLANPRNTNGTPSLIVARGGPPPPPTNYDRLVNSVPDQYLARVGATVPVWNGFAASLAWRVEGLPRYDLFGASNGFRRPGTSMFVEPGIGYSYRSSTISFNVPLAYYYNRRPDPNTGLEGDATFPREIFLTSYSWRFGRKPAPALQPADPATPVRQKESGTTSDERAASECQQR
jgi:hypothetical protein